jgi:riboflavin biosynthesis pyrimidine reductase
VYTNYIVSLDGRIAVEHPVTGEHRVPETIANRRDWRLFQELAAQADVLVTSARYVRQLAAGSAQDVPPISPEPEYADLTAWRTRQGLRPQPALVVLSASLDVPLDTVLARSDRPVLVVTGEGADPQRVRFLEHAGVTVITAGSGRRVEGKALVKSLAGLGFRSVYAMAGPQVLETLIIDSMLDRLYLTHAHRLVGGKSYDTLLESGLLNPPADFVLHALHYDAHAYEGAGQLFAVYGLRR